MVFKFLFGWIAEWRAKQAAAAEQRAAIESRRQAAKNTFRQEIEIRGVYTEYQKEACGIRGEIKVTAPHPEFGVGDTIEILSGQYLGHMLIEHLPGIAGIPCDFQLERYSSSRDLDEVAAGRKPQVTASIITAVQLREPAYA